MIVVPQPLVPAGIVSMAGLVAARAMVAIRPPLPWSGPSWGLTLLLEVGLFSPQVVPLSRL